MAMFDQSAGAAGKAARWPSGGGLASYVHGASPVPLIGKTIGVSFDEAAGRWAKREALAVCHQGLRRSGRRFPMPGLGKSA